MQWTLRRLFLVIAAIGYAIAGVTKFGIAATVTSMAILSAAWFAYSRIPDPRRTRTVLFMLVGSTVLALYLGTYASFRVFRTFEFSLVADPDDPWNNIVVFSLDPVAQEFARNVYYPLVKWCPGHCAYPTGEEMKLLNHDPFTGERLTFYW